MRLLPAASRDNAPVPWALRRAWPRRMPGGAKGEGQGPPAAAWATVQWRMACSAMHVPPWHVPPYRQGGEMAGRGDLAHEGAEVVEAALHVAPLGLALQTLQRGT